MSTEMLQAGSFPGVVCLGFMSASAEALPASSVAKFIVFLCLGWSNRDSSQEFP